MRLDPSPIPKGNPTANSNRAYFSSDATVSISGHSLFTRSDACGKLKRNDHGRAVFTIQARPAGTKNQPSPEGLGP